MNRHEGKIEIPASGEMCPCGAGAYNRFAICSEEETDGLNLHYDICSRCGFKTYAHCEPDVKLERFIVWGRCPVNEHLEARLIGEKIINAATWAIAAVLAATAALLIHGRVT